MIPKVLEGTCTQGDRALEYWTMSEHCKERPSCKHTCIHPGWIVFFVDGQSSVFWSGIITQRKIDQTVRDYLENDPPEDVNYPRIGWQQMGMQL